MKKCLTCKKELKRKFYPRTDRIENDYQFNKRKYCDKSCACKANKPHVIKKGFSGYKWGDVLYLLNPDSGMTVKRNYNLITCQYCKGIVAPKLVKSPRGEIAWISSQAHNKKRYCDPSHKKLYEASRDYTPITHVFPIDVIQKYLSPGIQGNFNDYMVKA